MQLKTYNIHNGIVWFNNKYDFTSLGIPKCMSSGIREQFNLFETKHIYDITDKKIISIVRDPIKRFVSGYLEIMYPSRGFSNGRYHMVNIPSELFKILDKDFKDRSLISDINEQHILSSFKLFIECIHNYGFFDPHIAPQIEHLRNIETKVMFSNVNVFKISELSKLEEFIGHKLQHRNSCEQKEIRNIITAMIHNDYPYHDTTLKEVIEDLYSEDIKYINEL